MVGDHRSWKWRGICNIRSSNIVKFRRDGKGGGGRGRISYRWSRIVVWIWKRSIFRCFFFFSRCGCVSRVFPHYAMPRQSDERNPTGSLPPPPFSPCVFIINSARILFLEFHEIAKFDRLPSGPVMTHIMDRWFDNVINFAVGPPSVEIEKFSTFVICISSMYENIRKFRARSSQYRVLTSIMIITSTRMSARREIIDVEL